MSSIALIISVLVLFFVLSLKKRVRHLEDVLVNRGIALREEIVYEVKAAPPPTPVTAPQPALSERSDVFGKLVDWLREEWLVKLGALLLLIGFGWLARYAFLNNWIGPAGRITLGLLGGVGLLITGWWRIRTHVHQGSIFLSLGSGVILVTIFAARFLYGFFTPSSALTVMFLSTAFVAFASVRFRVPSLSLVSIALAGAAPLLTHAPTADYIGLFAYVFIVVTGVLWIVAITGWRFLTFAALVLVSFYSVSHVIGNVSKDIDALLLFAYAFTGLFFITSMIGILRAPVRDIKGDIITAAGIGLFLLAWIWQAAPGEWQSLLLSAWMVVFAAGAFQALRITRMQYPFYSYGGVSIVLLGAALAAELDGAMLVIAFTLEAALIPLLMYSVLKNVRAAFLSAALFIVPIVLSVESLQARIWRTIVFHEHFFVLLLLGISLAGIGYLFSSFRDKRFFYVPVSFMVGGSFYIYALAWLSLHAALENDDLAVMTALALYTVIGLVAYFGRVGADEFVPAMRAYGAALLGFVVARLLLIDVWKMALTGRIITFFVIGTLLMSTAFFWRKRQKPLNNFSTQSDSDKFTI